MDNKELSNKLTDTLNKLIKRDNKEGKVIGKHKLYLKGIDSKGNKIWGSKVIK